MSTSQDGHMHMRIHTSTACPHKYMNILYPYACTYTCTVYVHAHVYIRIHTSHVLRYMHMYVIDRRNMHMAVHVVV